MTDLRMACRQLLKSPGYSAIAVATLGLGIGLVTTQFSLVDGVLLRPMPFPEAARLQHVGRPLEHLIEVNPKMANAQRRSLASRP